MLATIEMEKTYYKVFEYLCLSILIQKRYGFESNFDFHGWLVNIQEWMEGIKEYEDLEKIRERKKELLSVHKKITSLLDKLEFGDALQEPTIYFQMALEKELNALPVIPSKRPHKTYTVRLVSLLIMMYKEGSGKNPSCYRVEHTSKYNGEFYCFINDMLPVLKKYGITVEAKIETLARYAAELIPKRRKDKPYIHKIIQIDESLL